MAAAFVAALAGGGAMLGGGGTAAIAEVLKDPLSLLADRSPGSRAPGAQFAKGKPGGPVEMVLSTIRERPQPVLEAAAPVTSIDPLTAPLLAVLPEEPVAPDGAPEPSAGGPLFTGGGGPGFFVPIGGGGGGGGGGSPNPPEVTPTPVPTSPPPPGCCDPDPPVIPAVPEPSTWVMLILGFFMVGATLRAKTRQTAGARAA